MNHEVTKKQNLLDEKGNLNEPGYSKTEVFHYDRKQIKVAKFKIKEWDYYFVGNKKYGLCLTVGDNGYVGSIGNVAYKTKNTTINFDNDGVVRHLHGTRKNFAKDKDLIIDIKLYNAPLESMFIATPFKKKKHFYFLI